MDVVLTWAEQWTLLPRHRRVFSHVTGRRLELNCRCPLPRWLIQAVAVLHKLGLGRGGYVIGVCVVTVGGVLAPRAIPPFDHILQASA